MSKLDCRILAPTVSPHGHTHAHAHILLPLTDALLVCYAEKEYYISSEQLGFVAPNVFHRCFCPAAVVTINIPVDMIKKSDLEILTSRVVLPLQGVLVPLIALIKTEIARDPESDSIRYLYYYLYDKLVETNGIRSLRYICEHFGEPVTLSLLAKMENYNVSYFIDWFKHKTGYSPAHYLRRVRLEKAKELLQTTHYRMIEIALQVGYNSNSSFTRAFKEAEGISPRAYRLRVQDKMRAAGGGYPAGGKTDA